MKYDLYTTHVTKCTYNENQYQAEESLTSTYNGGPSHSKNCLGLSIEFLVGYRLRQSHFCNKLSSSRDVVKLPLTLLIAFSRGNDIWSMYIDEFPNFKEMYYCCSSSSTPRRLSMR